MHYLFFIIVIAVVLAVLAVASFTNFELDDYHYDRLKWLVIRWSYFVTFIALIVKTFEIPYGIETVTIVAGIGAMFAGLLNISAKEYNQPIAMDIEGMQYLEDYEDYEEIEEVEADE